MSRQLSGAQWDEGGVTSSHEGKVERRMGRPDARRDGQVQADSIERLYLAYQCLFDCRGLAI